MGSGKKNDDCLFCANLLTSRVILGVLVGILSVLLFASIYVLESNDNSITVKISTEERIMILQREVIADRKIIKILQNSIDEDMGIQNDL